ncbi:hypothetical protein HETIRDRAFT_103610 [Heterobasidion irregulare TC 32-1]|uniref:Uncharacterized protein n=1 Tax=Heterobasidion irregulare (strain TC 32-1) TaxID=747525 RepID=W4K432_HETIT|nr:uncharacterized protein HETIRDRAFT_103610 [Heterobasidion irregulare TC 32-1]ETW79791.1 hypothetical protein HETIRDRAFT_103610 [Heterobasidion irregulare TC 32-1]
MSQYQRTPPHEFDTSMSGTERDPDRVGDTGRPSGASEFDRSAPSSDADFAQPQLRSGSGYDSHRRDAGDELGLGRRGLAGYSREPHPDNQARGTAGHWIERPTGAGSAQSDLDREDVQIGKPGFADKTMGKISRKPVMQERGELRATEGKSAVQRDL